MTPRLPAGLAIFVLAATTQLGGQPRPAEPPDPAREYPSFDSMLTYIVRHDAHARRAEEALRMAPADASTIQLLFEAKRVNDAITSLEAAARGPLDNLIDAIRVLAQNFHALTDDPTVSYTDRVTVMIAPVRARLTALPREDAARLSRPLLRIDHDLGVNAGRRSDWDTRLAAFVQGYRGTEEALLAEVEVIDLGTNERAKIAALDAFWRAHPASAAGAKALRLKGSTLHNLGISATEPPASDPTERFLQVVAIADELGSGRYPDSEWVRNSPQLISGFFVSSSPPPAYQPGNVDRMLAEYQRFVRRHFNVGDDPGGSLRNMITSKIVELHALQGIDRVTSVEKTLADLEESGADKRAVALFRAEYLARLAAGEKETPGASRPKAEAALIALAREGTDFYTRRAAATLAGLLMYHRDYKRALPAYEAYASRFPDSSFAWVALIRAGQCLMELGEPGKAAEKFEAAASTAPHGALPQAVGSALAGQAYDALGQFDRSLVAYRRALASWTFGYWEDATPEPSQARQPAPATGELTRRRRVRQQNLADRVASLERNLVTNVGPLLERASIQIDAREFTAARTTLASASLQARSADDHAAVRLLDHRAQLELAMELLAIGSAHIDVSGGLKSLQSIAPEPFDANVGFAGLTRAVALFGNGAEDQARALMTATLGAWRDSQRELRAGRSSSPFAGDVAAIRQSLLRPGGAFETLARNYFSPFRSAPTSGYVVVNPDVLIVATNGTSTRHTVYQDFPELPNVIFWTTDEAALAARLGVTLAGTGARATTNASVREFWNSAFATRDRHEGAWFVDSYPRTASIRFLDEARTRAAVLVIAGYTSATVLFEKRNGAWLPVKVLTVTMS